jgi:hypothetical protein
MFGQSEFEVAVNAIRKSGFDRMSGYGSRRWRRCGAPTDGGICARNTGVRKARRWRQCGAPVEGLAVSLVKCLRKGISGSSWERSVEFELWESTAIASLIGEKFKPLSPNICLPETRSPGLRRPRSFLMRVIKRFRVTRRTYQKCGGGQEFGL